MTDDRPDPSIAERAEPERRAGPSRPGVGVRRFGYLIAIAVNLVLLYLANGVPNWDVPFITNDWPDVLWIVNLSLQATIVANLIFLAYDPRWFRHGVQVLLNALSLVVFYNLHRVFPFDFGQAQFNDLARLALLVGMFGLGIALVVEFVGLVLGRDR